MIYLKRILLLAHWALVPNTIGWIGVGLWATLFMDDLGDAYWLGAGAIVIPFVVLVSLRYIIEGEVHFLPK